MYITNRTIDGGGNVDKIYRIGSFNLHNIGTSAFTNARDLEKIAEIIKKEHLDVVALQEVLTEGDVFTKNDLHSVTAKQNIIKYLGGSEHWGFEWACSGDESNRHEGYAFLWNKDRLDLPTAEIVRNGQRFKRVYTPRMIKINRQNMKRQPYFARFTPHGKAGGSNFEIRLLCVHTYFGEDTVADRNIRQNELDVLMKDIYPQAADKIYQNALPSYTILLGDYNAELLTDDNKKAVSERNGYRKSIGVKKPAVMKTDNTGSVYSERYKVTVKTTQDQLTTLKSKNKDSSDEAFADRGYASNYDHFSYNEEAMGHVIKKKPKRIDAVRKYYGDDFEGYFKKVSDHIPIVIELQIN